METKLNESLKYIKWWRHFILGVLAYYSLTWANFQIALDCPYIKNVYQIV